MQAVAVFGIHTDVFELSETPTQQRQISINYRALLVDAINI